MNDLGIANVRLLLVEDNPKYLGLLVETLGRKFGYQCMDTARNATHARDKLNQQPFDVVVAEMRLDNDVAGGFAVLDEVKARNITSVVIILTANDTVVDCRRAFREGAWDYIPKSMKGDVFEELHESIRAAITYFNKWEKREDKAWIAENMDDLLNKYRGQYIAVLNNSVMACASTEEAVKQELAERKLPLFLSTIKKIGAARPIAELIALGESVTLEFKSTLRWDVRRNKKVDELQYAVLKTIAAFLNSEGGTLLIGVKDDGTIFGLERDLSFVKGKTLDGFEQLLMNLTHTRIGDRFARLIDIRFESIDGKNVCAVEIDQAAQPAYMTNKQGNKEFYIRQGNGSRSPDIEEAVNYIQLHIRGVE